MKTTPQRHHHGTPVGESVPASPTIIRVHRRRLLVIVASGLAVTTLISAAVARWSAGELHRSEEELGRTLDTLQAVADEHELDFAEVERAIENALREYADQKNPLNPTALDVLSGGKRFFARHVASGHADPETIATAYRYLGEIDRLLGLISQSEAAYCQSRRLFRRLCDESPDPAYGILLARTNKSLGCLLASSGRADEAVVPMSEAVAELDELLADDPENATALGELSVVSRNLGLILALGGGDGTKEVQRSIEQTRLLASDGPDAVRTAEFIVDSQQILSQLLWRQGRFSEAENVCRQSIHEVDGLLKRSQAFADRDGRRVHTLTYHQAISMAQSNLARLQRKCEGHSPSADGWQWSPLVQMPERILQADLLLHGSLPGEFEKQDGILMAWLDEDWYEEMAVRVAAETHQHVQITILVEDELVEERAKHVLRTAGVAPEDVRFCHIPTDTAWVRDYGPMVINTGDRTCQSVAPSRPLIPQDLRLKDAHVALASSRLFKMPVVPTPMLLEGGEVLTNGAGLCVVSAGMLESNRQAGYTESHVTNTIKRLFGATHVVYLEPLHDEPTGHVDWFATFTATDTIVIGDYRGSDPANQRLLDQHAKRLAGVRVTNGPLKVVRVPMPPRGETYFGGTYTNVVFANGVLLVPTYAEAAPEVEHEAFEVFRQLLPGWQVVGIDCTRLVARHGALHCAVANLHSLAPSLCLE